MIPPDSQNERQLIVVGDRVLIKLDTGEERTASGLILPETVAEKQQVLSGRVIAVGPGVPMPSADDADAEPWRQAERSPRYIPMQAMPGDLALFMRKAGVEIKYRGQEFLIVPQAAILVLLRDEHESLFAAE